MTNSSKFSRFFGILILALLLAVGGRASAEEKASVEVRAAKIRKSPEQWADAAATVKYGDVLSVVSREGDWVRVRSGKSEGFIHASALTSKTIIFTDLKTSAKDMAFAPSEVNLAGKGFNKSVEGEFKKAAVDSDYALLDSLEKESGPAPAALRKFLAEGDLGKVG